MHTFPLPRKGQRGQALAEGALVAAVLVLFAFLGIVAIPLHRAHTAAEAAAYSCAQFIAQYPNQPERAAQMGYAEAQRILHGNWSALGGSSFRLSVLPPAKAGGYGRCQVAYSTRLFFDPLGIGTQERTITIEARSERWKADWRH